MDKPKILFVCQRYGLEINGGAETECREYAERLSPWYRVEVLTTCALDYTSWANHYPAGEETLNGVLVRRFPVQTPRSEKAFARAAAELTGRHSLEAEQTWLAEQGPRAPELLAFLAEHGKDYACVLFMTYLYEPTARGIGLCSCARKLLIPTAHDERPIYYAIFDRVFAAADGFVYNSEAEKRFVERRFPFAAGRPSVTVGSGVACPADESALPDVKERFGLEGTYLLYSGRIDVSKGCDILFRNFIAYKERHPGELTLALTGRAAMKLPERGDIRALGFVSEEEKFALMRGARCFLQPSPFESLSIVTLESLLMGRPVLVNGACEVLADHCRLSNAGLYYRNYYEFEACLDFLLADSAAYAAMCGNGRRYVERCYSWDAIVGKLRQLIEE